MDNLDKIKEMCLFILKDAEDLLEQAGVHDLYSLGLDEDGCPYAEGNYSDTYDSGYDYGSLAGQQVLATRILKVLDGQV